MRDIHIEHHGIKGQKWGVMNGPPYPLGSASYSAQKTPSAIVGKAGKLVVNGTKASKLANKGFGWMNGTEYLSREPNTKVRQTAQKAGLKLKTTPLTLKDDCSATDPDYNPYGSLEQRNNCSHTSIALAMRRMGYDVEAKDVPTSRAEGTSYEDLEKYFDSLKVKDIYLGVHLSSSKYEQALSQKILKTCNDENGAVGMMLFGYAGINLGHYITWENQNGVIRYSDGQNNISDLSSYLFDGMKSGQIMRAVRVARLDNLTINTNTIGEVVKSK